MDSKKPKLDYDELINHVEQMATPIDFDTLIENGLLIPEGKWYRVPDKDALPEHVSKKIKGIRTDKCGVKITFHGHKKYEKMKKKYL